MNDVANLVESVVKAHGYEVTERSGSDFTARRDGETLYVHVSVDTMVQSTKVLEVMATNKADRFLIVSPLGFDESQRLLGGGGRLHLWDRGRLERAIGRATISSVMGEPLGDIFSIQEGPSPAVEVETTGGEAPEPAPLFVEEASHQGERILRPSISMEDVISLSKSKVGGFKFTLELVPHYLFQYSCELVAEGWPKGREVRGIVSVNALTEGAEFWRGGFETVASIDATHTKLEPKMSEDDAMYKARRFALEKNTRFIEDVQDKGTVTIFEKKRVVPRDNRVELEPLGIVFVPVWCVEGSAGSMIVNAVDGRVVQEKLYTH